MLKSCIIRLLFLSISLIFIDAIALENPASEYCVQSGGDLEIQKRGDGGEYGVCSFEDNRQCEEWALFNGKCPLNGVKITGYTSEAQIYCAIRGGKVLIVSDDKDSDCFLPDGTTCNLLEFFNGKCAY